MKKHNRSCSRPNAEPWCSNLRIIEVDGKTYKKMKDMFSS